MPHVWLCQNNHLMPQASLSLSLLQQPIESGFQRPWKGKGGGGYQPTKLIKAFSIHNFPILPPPPRFSLPFLTQKYTPESAHFEVSSQFRVSLRSPNDLSSRYILDKYWYILLVFLNPSEILFRILLENVILLSRGGGEGECIRILLTRCVQTVFFFLSFFSALYPLCFQEIS